MKEWLGVSGSPTSLDKGVMSVLMAKVRVLGESGES